MVQKTVAAFSRLDILVINAGVKADRHPVTDSQIDAWLQTFAVNIHGAYYCAKAAIPYLKEAGGGKIITIGSGMGHNGKAAAAAYCCSKTALWMFTRVLAQELWTEGISVNELIPGPVQTEMTNPLAGQDRGVFGIESEWIKTPQDIVPLALFLATQPAVGSTAQRFSLMRLDTCVYGLALSKYLFDNICLSSTINKNILPGLT